MMHSPNTSFFGSRKRNSSANPWFALVVVLSVSLLGCGRIISQKATDQLIAGDAVDRTVSQIDFRILMGKKVFLDTQYINKAIPGVGFVTSEYMISSVRQKMMCDGCLLQEKTDDADFVVEMRIGALGADGHEVIYGVPPNNYLTIAASVVPTAPQAAASIPSMPELSVGKKDDQMAAAKIALFAYNRRTREPIWQSGINESRSMVADRWYFGAGPFHKGNIYGTKKQSDPGFFGSGDEDEPAKQEYFVERRFADPTKSLADNPPPPKPGPGTTPSAAAPVSATPAAGVAAAAGATPPAAATTPAAVPAATAAAAPPAASTPPSATTPTTASTPPASTSLANSSSPAASTKATSATSAPAPGASPAPAATKTTAVPGTTTPVTGSVTPLTTLAAGSSPTVSSTAP
ncbi:MAG TPA: DUF6655 family protein [Planctomycetaceae bacterium]|nr:DUF6655 family protein [Planctomycetaceae bacterium]